MALATIDQLKEYLGEASDKDDTLLTRIVAAATDAIENYCNRTFASTLHTNEMYDGTGTKVLTLRHSPIISVTTLKEAGAIMTTGNDPNGSPAPDALIYAEEGELIRPWFYWLPYRRWYSVTYTAGYAAIPAAIIQACLDLSALMLREKEHIGLSQKTSGQQIATYRGDIPKQIQKILDGYADVTLGRIN